MMKEGRQEHTKQTQKITREDFDRFFHENYCPMEYELVKRDFEEIYEENPDSFFADGTVVEDLTEDNFILYMSGDIYSALEQVVEENADALNQEIADAVAELAAADRQADLITRTYWDNNHDLVTAFLRRLYREKIVPGRGI